MAKRKAPFDKFILYFKQSNHPKEFQFKFSLESVEN